MSRMRRVLLWLGAAAGVCGLVALAAVETATKQSEHRPPIGLQLTPVSGPGSDAPLTADVTQGALRVVQPDGTVVECPLEHTDVHAEIAGFLARVKVTQTFYNPTDEPIEAVYLFPLPHQAAVDDMTMVVGQRRIVGVIKRRDEARQIYEQALAAGQTAALLEQERPNIFTQSVGNIGPGQKVRIEISYVDVLKYDMGTYEFYFPMVVGPRYTPARSAGQPGVGDVERINPPVLRPEQRNGHDISLSVRLDAGVPVHQLTVANHQAEIERQDDRTARVRLSPSDSIPNKDFVLRYDVVGEKPEMALLAHTGQYGDHARLGDGYFMLMIQPKEDEQLKKSPPREIVFLVDVSGSMSGQPTAKVREVMQHMLKLCREEDSVQVVTFAGMANRLFERPVPVTPANIQRALQFTSSLRGGGGTEMLKGVKMAIDQPLDPQRVRIVVMLTDGYIGNEAEIIEHVGAHCGDHVRFWAIGIGQAPNMFLIDGVARQGGGMGKRLGLDDDSEALAIEVMTRIQRAQLANVQIDWGQLDVCETHPVKIPELWAGRPIVLFGRYRRPGQGTIVVRGTVEGQPAEWPLKVALPKHQTEHDVIAKVWARQKIEELMQQTYYAGSPAVEEEVTAIALSYRLMSQYTSFVAVDAESARQLAEAPRPPRRMVVPVPLPEGTQWSGFFGEGVPLPAEVAAEMPVGNRLAYRLGDARQKQAAVSGRIATAKPSADASFAAPAGPPAAKAPVARTPAFGALRSSLAPMPASQPAAASTPAPSRGSAGFGGGVINGAATRESLRRMIAPLDELQEEADAASEAGPPAIAMDYFLQQIAERGKQYRQDASRALQQGQKLVKEGEYDAARTQLVLALLLDTAATAAGVSDGQISADALQQIQQLHQKQTQLWSKQCPALTRRLDLVLVDMPLGEALQQIARAAEISIKLDSDALGDVVPLLGGRPPRVRFVDLRGATLAQALDWLVLPARLRWQLKADTITVSSDRRAAGRTAWVYDLSGLILPTEDELQSAGDKDPVKLLSESANQIKQLVEKQLGDSTNSARWFAPGQLLVVADRPAHERIARLVDQLSTSDGQASDPDVAKLRAKTAARMKSYRSRLSRIHEAIDRATVRAAHETFGLALLADALYGKVNEQALAELQIAWRSPATPKLLDGPEAIVATRSLWLICESARLLPQSAALRQLRDAASQQVRPSRERLLETLKKEPSAAGARYAVLYAALAAVAQKEAGGDFAERAKTLLLKSQDQTNALISALLGDRSDAGAKAVSEQLERLQTADDVLLAAIAARRMGGPAWETFRRQAPQVLPHLPIPGEVIVLISRLDGAGGALAQADN